MEFLHFGLKTEEISQLFFEEILHIKFENNMIKKLSINKMLGTSIFFYKKNEDLNTIKGWKLMQIIKMIPFYEQEEDLNIKLLIHFMTQLE